LVKKQIENLLENESKMRGRKNMVIEPLTGHWVRLRCAEESDAEFTLAIRNDPELTKIMPKVHNTIPGQREWIRRQREAEDSCFLVIETLEGKALGTLGFYDIDEQNSSCEVGRTISYGSPVENVESHVLLYDYLYGERKMKRIIGHVQLKNKQVRTFGERLGGKFVRDVMMEGEAGAAALYYNYPKEYYAKRPKIIALLDAVIRGESEGR